MFPMTSVFRTIFLPALLLLPTITLANQSIRVHSHRGETDFAPQNTVESIKLAFDMGSQMIETDFCLTNFGTIVCIHDRRELKDLWGIDKDPSLLTDAEIKAAKLVNASKYPPKYADCKLPTIDDIFAVIPKDKSFELEIKLYGPSFADKVDAARQRAGLNYNNIIITSFNPSEIKDFKRRYPAYQTLLIVSMNDSSKNWTAQKLIDVAKDANASQIAIGAYRKIDKKFVDALHLAGFKVGVWQVENLNDLLYAAQIGADRVCSNHAFKLRQSFNLIKALDFL